MVARIRVPVPFDLGKRHPSGTTRYSDYYNAYDYALGGIPFMSGISPENPLVRAGTEIKRQQIDQSAEPGEQSLTGWWLRSQTSFHLGADIKFGDPAADESAVARFADAEGVDVWEPGQVSLLRAAEQQHTNSGTHPYLMVGGRVGTTDLLVSASNTSMWIMVGGGTVHTVTVAGSPASPWQSITSDGTSVYASNNDGVWRLDLTSGALSSLTASKLWTFAAGTSSVLGWAMGRLMAGRDTKLYELVPPAGSPPYALPTNAVYTSPVPGWRWTSITAGPERIYASGHAGNRGSILSLALDASGAIPTLSGGTEVAQLPTGEYPLCIRCYLGSVMAIGTTMGVRVAQVAAGGTIEYGPLTRVPGGVLDFVGRDRFLYATGSQIFEDGSPGLMRFDLSEQLPNQQFAHAKDLRAGVPGNFVSQSVAIFGDSGRVAVGVTGSGAFLESATVLEPQGYLLTAKVRFNMLWPKLFKRLSIRGEIIGRMQIVIIDQHGGETQIAALDTNTDISEDFTINYPSEPQEYISLRFQIFRETSTTGPIFRGYQLKALPGGSKPRQIIVPFLCYDLEQDKDGNKYGHPGWSLERLKAVEELDGAGQVVIFEDLIGQTVHLVLIEKIEFRQIVPPAGSSSREGGVLTVSLRTLD